MPQGRSALEELLECRSLPTLPAVAVKMLSLMRDDNATLKDIAKLVRSDQGLATKVLRTVNSPLYGLRQPCQSIDRAVTMLGHNAIRSIVLGFSLMDTARNTPLGEGFDLRAYWTRVIYSAAAAKQVALMTGACDPDEAFTGGLFQDMGMLAMATVFRERYAQVVREKSHTELSSLEAREFDFDHTKAGAELGARWRLPEQTIACIRRHHQPDLADEANLAAVRCVSLGSMLATELLAPESQRSFAAVGRSIKAWFGADAPDLASLVRSTTEDAGNLAVVFDTAIDAPDDIEGILADALEQLVHHHVAISRESQTLLQESLTDSLTGIGNRRAFDQALDAQFLTATMEPGRALTVMFIDADHFKAVNDHYGHAVGDAVLAALAHRMRQALGSRGELFRYGGEEFAILAAELTPAEAMKIADEVRHAVAAAPLDLRSAEVGLAEAPATISMGVATHCDASPFGDATGLLSAADEGSYNAKRAGRNRVAAPTEAPVVQTGPQPLRVLLVEDDSLAATVIRARLGRRSDVEVTWIRTRDGAIKRLDECEQGRQPAPDIVLCDLFLDAQQLGTEVIHAVRQRARLAHVPVWAMSASDKPADMEACLSAGATAFRTKGAIVGSLTQWIDEVLASGRAAA